MYVRIPGQELLLYCTFLLHKKIFILDYSEFILIFRVLEMQIRFDYTALRLKMFQEFIARIYFQHMRYL